MGALYWKVIAAPSGDQHHLDRIALLRLVGYETMVSEPLDPLLASSCTRGEALSLNISSKGMLLLMDKQPCLDQVFRITVPSPVPSIASPTLADVRWTRRVPLVWESERALYFVGLRFML